MSKIPRIVVIGGGTGSFVVASGLSSMPCHVSVLLTMADDGGSNKVLRDEFGLLPTSGVRQAILALSKDKTLLRELFNYRYYKGGSGINGMTFGNLFMAAMADVTGSQKKGIEETCRLLQVQGDIIPISYDRVSLVAKYSNGKIKKGEHNIDTPEKGKINKIIDLKTVPSAKLNPEAKEAIKKADLIIIGPGDFYTNTVANLVVGNLSKEINSSRAKVLFVSNLMNSVSETPNYKLSDFFADLGKYLNLRAIDFVLINNKLDFSKKALDSYKKEKAYPIEDDLKPEHINPQVKLIRADLLSGRITKKVKGDKLSRSMIRHDQDKLAKQIMKLLWDIS